jgi:hypothetical protein
MAVLALRVEMDDPLHWDTATRAAVFPTVAEKGALEIKQGLRR